MTGANVARAMQLSAPTVHEMVGRLERDGYITRGADKSISFTDGRPRAGRGRRPPPPADRALPHRRAGDPVGRRARGGRAARARDVAGARGAHAGRDRRREDVPARPPDRARARGSRASRSATSSTARRSPSCASRTRPRTCCTCSSDEGLEPGPRGHGRDGRRRARDRRLRRRRPRRSRARWPRRSRCSPIRRRRRAPRCPSSSCSARSATDAEAQMPSVLARDDAEDLVLVVDGTAIVGDDRRGRVVRRDPERVDVAARDREPEVVADEAAPDGAGIVVAGARVLRHPADVLLRLIGIPRESRDTHVRADRHRAGAGVLVRLK